MDFMIKPNVPGSVKSTGRTWINYAIIVSTVKTVFSNVKHVAQLYITKVWKPELFTAINDTPIREHSAVQQVQIKQKC